MRPLLDDKAATASSTHKDFAARVLAWYQQHGRHDLPWQLHRNPYRVWISEIMLQQTQVATVIPYFERFMQRFPALTDLAQASQDEVLHIWTGLGYYARARNLHQAARHIVNERQGKFPHRIEQLCALPGIGRSTAGAIVAMAFAQRGVILDGNVKRVLARHFTVAGHPTKATTQKQLWRLADLYTPRKRVADYTQAMMDLGASVCTRTQPACERCPLMNSCQAFERGTVAHYPQRKVATAKPIRYCRMYLVTDSRGACLLEQRANEGLWGGLWGPLERDMASDWSSIAQELKLSHDRSEPGRELSPFRHTFSHFHLQIEPIHRVLTHRPPQIRSDERWRWYLPGDNTPLGLSAVAVKLLGLIQSKDSR